MEEWYKKWFSHVRTKLNTSLTLRGQARALLIPVFRQLNRFFRRTSWFLPIYEVNWLKVCEVFTKLHVEFEHACYLLARSKKADTDWPVDAIDGGVSQGDGKHEFHYTLRRMEKIVEHVGLCLENQPSKPRNVEWVGFAD